jgi:hypothetical protein
MVRSLRVSGDISSTFGPMLRTCSSVSTSPAEKHQTGRQQTQQQLANPHKRKWLLLVSVAA